jgi:hypothetical protein
MNISSGTLLRSINVNKNFSFFINGSILNTKNISEFGFSGDNGKFSLFEFKSGNILDFNKRNVYSYNPNENFQISGNISNTYINYFINNIPICLYNTFSDNYYKYIYTKTDTDIDLDVFIKTSTLPNFDIQFSQPINLGQNITGYIKNLDPNPYSFQIFSGSFDNQIFYNISGLDTNFISGNKSGEIILNYILTTNPSNFFDTIEPITNLNGTLNLITNFGNISRNILLPINTPSLYLLDFVEIFTGVVGNNSIYNYELLIKSNDQNNIIKVYLKDFSGHNNETIFGTFLGTGVLSGNITNFVYGEDYLTGIISGNIVSSSLDFLGNNFSSDISKIYIEPAFATGEINYIYDLILTGGSGFGPPPPNFSIIGTGTGNLTQTAFIFISRPITGSASGILSGYWNEFFQSGSGLINFFPLSKFFTGNFILDYSHLVWSGNISNIGEPPKLNIIYGITGFDILSFQPEDSGILNKALAVKQSTGVALKSVLPFNSLSDLQSSGSVLFSINSFNGDSLFYPNSDSWFTETATTGFIEFNFSNFSPQDKKPITHYELNVSLLSNYYPYIFSLLGRNSNEENYTILDQKTGENFYSSDRRIFNISNNTFYNFIRLDISSGKPWAHKNSLNEEANLNLNKLNFYYIEKNISGVFRPSLTNINNNTYTVVDENSTFTGIIEAPFQSTINTEQAWNAFNFNNIAKISGYTTGLYISIKTPKPVNETIKKFYIEYVEGYTPNNLTLTASKDNINYVIFYSSTDKLNKIISGDITINETGFQYFKYDYSNLECYDNIFSNNNLNPNIYEISDDLNLICGKINNLNQNYVRFFIPNGYTLEGIKLLNYDSNLNSSFAIQNNTVFNLANNSLASGNINNTIINKNLLTGLEKRIFEPLNSQNYTIEFKTTGSSFINYRISLIIKNQNLCNISVQNAGFNFSGNSLTGTYIPSNRYSEEFKWNNYIYYEHSLINKSGAIWWDNNIGWVLGAGSGSTLSPNNYIIYASGGQTPPPFSQKIWSPVSGRPSPILQSLC